LRWCSALAAVLLLLAGFALWRLMQGPIVLDRFAPYLDTALERSVGGLRVAISRVRLGLDRDTHALDLAIAGVRLDRPNGEPLAAFPLVRASVGLGALLRGRLAATRLVFERPVLRLIREPDGAVRFGFGDKRRKAPVLAFAGLERWAVPPAPGAPFAALRQISIHDARVVLDDRQSGRHWRANHIDAVLTRNADGFFGDLSLAVAIGNRKPELRLGYDYSAAARTLGLTLAFGKFEPTALAALDPALRPLAALHAPISGTFETRLALSPLCAEGMRLDLGIGRGHFDSALFPGGAIAFDRGELHADYAPRDRTLRLAKLTLDLGGGAVVAIDGGLGDISPGLIAGTEETPADLAGRLGIIVSDIPIAKFASLWPVNLAPGGRRWALARIRGGVLERGAFRLALGLDLRAHAAKLALTHGTLRYRDLTIRYLDGLAPLRKVGGTAILSPDHIDFTPTSGALASLRVTGGSVRISDLDSRVARLAIELAAAGPIRDGLELADGAPFGSARRIGLDPARIGGRMAADLAVELPLSKTPKPADVAFGVKARLSGVSINSIAMGKVLSAGSFVLAVTRSGASLAGKARLGGVPAAIAARLPFTDGNGRAARYRIAATLDDAERRRLGVDFLPDHITGPVGVDLAYSGSASGHGEATALLDLKGARIGLAEAGWGKPPGLPAQARVVLDLDRGTIRGLPQIDMAAPGLAGRLAVTLDPATGHIARIDVPRLVVGGDDVTGTATRGVRGGWHVVLSGRSLDVSPWLRRLGKEGGVPGRTDDGMGSPSSRTSGQEDRPGIGMLALNARLDRLILGPGHELRAVDARLVREGAEWRNVRLDGRFDSGRMLSLRFGGEPADERLRFRADDLGATLRLLDITGSVVGGRVAVTGALTRSDGPSTLRQAQGSEPVLRGHIEGADYHLVHVPIFAKVLSLASLRAAASLLSGTGIPFTRLRGDFAYTPDRLVIEDLLAYGGAIGVTANGTYRSGGKRLDLQGTIIPAYTLNSIIGNLPVVGALLAGGKGQGLIAATYRLFGPSAMPEAAVNPLSALAPGFLRRLLQPNFGRPPPIAASPVQR
jgi:hypothetical protein